LGEIGTVPSNLWVRFSKRTWKAVYPSIARWQRGSAESLEGNKEALVPRSQSQFLHAIDGDWAQSIERYVALIG